MVNKYDDFYYENLKHKLKFIREKLNKNELDENTTTLYSSLISIIETVCLGIILPEQIIEYKNKLRKAIIDTINRYDEETKYASSNFNFQLAQQTEQTNIAKKESLQNILDRIDECDSTNLAEFIIDKIFMDLNTLENLKNSIISEGKAELKGITYEGIALIDGGTINYTTLKKLYDDITISGILNKRKQLREILFIDDTYKKLNDVGNFIDLIAYLEIYYYFIGEYNTLESSLIQKINSTKKLKNYCIKQENGQYSIDMDSIMERLTKKRIFENKNSKNNLLLTNIEQVQYYKNITNYITELMTKKGVKITPSLYWYQEYLLVFSDEEKIKVREQIKNKNGFGNIEKDIPENAIQLMISIKDIITRKLKKLEPSDEQIEQLSVLSCFSIAVNKDESLITKSNFLLGNDLKWVDLLCSMYSTNFATPKQAESILIGIKGKEDYNKMLEETQTIQRQAYNIPETLPISLEKKGNSKKLTYKRYC